eukprot:232835_1
MAQNGAFTSITQSEYCRVTDVKDEVSALRLMPSTKIMDLLQWYPSLRPRIYIITGHAMRVDLTTQMKHRSTNEWQSFMLLSSATNIKFSTMATLHIKLAAHELRELVAPSLFEDLNDDPFIWLKNKKISTAYLIPSFDKTKAFKMKKHGYKDLWMCTLSCSTEQRFTYKVALKYEPFKPVTKWQMNNIP